MTLASVPVSAAPGDVYEEKAVPDAPSERSPVRMSVDTAKLGKEAQSTRDWVLRDGGTALEEAGLRIGEEADAPEVRVSIEPKDLGYAVVVEIWEAGGEAAAVRRGPKICDSCTRSELLELVRNELLFAGGWLSSSPAAERTTEDAPAQEGEEPDEVAELETEPTPADGDQPRGKLHALGWSGVGVGALGVASFTGGLVVALRSYEARGEPGDYQVPSLEHPQRVGWALVGVGAAAMVGGAVMVALDLRRGRTRNRGTLSAGPWLEHQAGGLWVRRRF